MYSAAGIQYQIRDKILLNHVTISFQPGCVSAILGANGAGKSTLLKILAGDIKPTQGHVSLHDNPVETICPKRLAQQRSVMPQSSSLSFSFTVTEVVEMGRAPHVTLSSPIKNREIVTQAMNDMDVYHLKDRDYTTLSGGERQRVHLARVLAQVWEANPYPCRFMLLDEPTSNLDLHHQHETLAYMKTFSRHGVGIVIVLHDLNLAAMYADTIYVLQKGKLLTHGSPKEVFNTELIAQAFAYHAHIQSHPDMDCPMIIPAIETGNRSNSIHQNQNQPVYH